VEFPYHEKKRKTHKNSGKSSHQAKAGGGNERGPPATRMGLTMGGALKRLRQQAHDPLPQKRGK